MNKYNICILIRMSIKKRFEEVNQKKSAKFDKSVKLWYTIIVFISYIKHHEKNRKENRSQARSRKIKDWKID